MINHLLIAGQSLAVWWDKYPVTFEAFKETRVYMGDTSEWTLTVAAEGGSAMLKENAHAHMADRYWWDRVAAQPGPSLTKALAIIEGLTFTHAVWIQGQADGTNWDSNNYGWGALEYYYKTAFKAISPLLFPNGKMHLNVLEWRVPSQVGDSYIREAHELLIANGWALPGAYPNATMVKLLENGNLVHPSPIAGCANMGERVARAIG